MFPRSRTWQLFCFALALVALGCSSGGGGAGVDAGNQQNGTDLISGDIAPEDVAFQFASTDDQGAGPFGIRGKNIDFDEENGELCVDLSVVNLSDDTYKEPVTMTFLTLAPEGVSVANPDNEENGSGAYIMFEFDGEGDWEPGEESLPRTTKFAMKSKTSIAFVARVDVGTGGSDLGAIGGLVWNDENGDGILDEGEGGLEGVTIALMSDGDDDMSTTSDEEGMYLFPELEAGFYEVMKKEAEGLYPTTETRIQVILIDDDGIVDPYLAANFGCQVVVDSMPPTADVGGVVFHDANCNGEQDEDEPGIEGVEVCMIDGDERPRNVSERECVTTDENGEYWFEDLQPGAYIFKKVVPEGYESTTDNPVKIMVPRPKDDEAGIDDIDDVDFGCKEKPTASISGYVFDDENCNRWWESNEPGKAGVKVLLESYKMEPMMVESGEDGSYSFDGLHEGKYFVSIVVPEGYMATTDKVVDVRLKETDDGLEDVEDVTFGVVVHEDSGGESASR